MNGYVAHLQALLLALRRLPDMALSKRLLEGATMRTREASEDSDDEEPRPGGPRYATDFDDAPRSCIDLLALNRLWAKNIDMLL